MDTLERNPRLHRAGTLFARTPLMPIDGEAIPAASDKIFAVYNPVAGAIIANVPSPTRRTSIRRSPRHAFERRSTRISPSDRGRIDTGCAFLSSSSSGT